MKGAQVLPNEMELFIKKFQNITEDWKGKKITSDAFSLLDNISVASSTKDAPLKSGIQTGRGENVGKGRRHKSGKKINILHFFCMPEEGQ